MRNTNSKSSAPKRKPFAASLKELMLTTAGRCLLRIGGRVQAVGAALIFRAEDGRVPRLRVYILAFAVAILAAFIIWDASAGADLPGVSASNRAGAAAW